LFKWITPSLVVATDWDPLLTETDATMATVWVEKGHTAFVKSDDVARQVLYNFGLTDEEVEDRMHFAETGEVLHR
jgi:hypothetical protein